MKLFLKSIPLFLALFTLLGCKEEIPQKEMIRPIRAIEISDPAEFTKRWFPGQAKATQEVDMSFRVAGPLITLPVNVGDEVRKGHELARIDPRDFEVNLREDQGRLEKAKVELKRAESDYDRILRIQKEDPGAASQAMIDRRRQQVESTRAEIRSLTAAMESARDKVSYTYLKAPFDGIITATYVENHEDVKAKQPIVRLIDHSQIEMIISIPEDMISQADYLRSAGKSLRVRFDSFPDHDIEAEIKEIGAGKNRYQAVLDAALSRLRPVVLAAATTVLGVIPLLQDVFWVGMAVTIMAGLTFGTILTMVLVPTLYCTFFRVKSPSGSKQGAAG